MSEAVIEKLGVLPMPSWEATNQMAKDQASVYELPTVKTFLTDLDLKLLTFQKRHAIAPSAMKELDVILDLLVAAVHTAAEAERDIPDTSDFFAPSPVREHLHNESVQEDSPFVPYQMTEKSNIVGEVVIAVKNVLLSAVELLRDALLEPYVGDDFFNTEPARDETGRDLRSPNVFSRRFGQLITGHVRETSGRADAVPLFLFFFSDGAQKTRKSSMHPCFMSIGNFPAFVRDSFLGKKFLAFFALLKGKCV